MCGVDRSLFSRRAMLGGLGASSLLVLSGCAENAQLGRQQLILVDEGQLNEMGVAAWRDIRRHEQVSRRPQVNRRIQEIGSRIVRAAGLEDDYDWEYAVFENEQANAFALPGGKVYITAGLMRQMENERELAAVLGHEVAHVAARHNVQALQRQLGASLVVQLAAAAVSPERAQAAKIAAMLRRVADELDA